MKEVTISPKTAFRIIQWLSQDNDSDARALVNLLSREALGDIKAEERQPVRLKTDEHNLQRIWEALGLQLSGNASLDGIIMAIEHSKDVAKQRNDNLTERFNLLEALRNQLSVLQWDQMSGALANLKQNYVEAERDLKKEQESSKYLRESLKQIEQALVLPPGYTAAYLVEQVGIRVKSHEILRSFMKASGFTDNDGVPTMLSVLEYRKSVTAAADAIAEDTNLDSAVYLVKMNEELKRLQRTAERGADDQAKLAKVEAFLTDSNSLYPVDYTAASHHARWHMASELLGIIKGNGAVCAPADSMICQAVKAADSASDPVLHLTAKVSELEAKLAQANRVVQDVRNAVLQPHQHYEIIVKDVMEAVK